MMATLNDANLLLNRHYFSFVMDRESRPDILKVFVLWNEGIAIPFHCYDFYAA